MQLQIHGKDAGTSPVDATLMCSGALRGLKLSAPARHAAGASLARIAIARFEAEIAQGSAVHGRYLVSMTVRRDRAA